MNLLNAFYCKICDNLEVNSMACGTGEQADVDLLFSVITTYKEYPSEIDACDSKQN